METLTAEERQRARAFMQAGLRPTIDETVKQLDTLSEKANLVLKGKIRYEGKEYIFGDWVTIADNSRLYNYTLSRVQNWIDREIVPRQNVVVSRELKNLKLLKNVPYRP
ncbi:hypothetical protein DYU11_11085 [Fibrisoma montanum]|uniref:Uncharacterized protein n=1 Tax=Fibrisoma montanum TaxID=2305895 RepID=A0A418MAX6_9BACT|nr:hypothetical protein [Fibrisoma montanum]RIV23528.1 hypothetical protein DYU11_11085 [Fibrisoma montanum]